MLRFFNDTFSGLFVINFTMYNIIALIAAKLQAFKIVSLLMAHGVVTSTSDTVTPTSKVKLLILQLQSLLL